MITIHSSLSAKLAKSFLSVGTNFVLGFPGDDEVVGLSPHLVAEVGEVDANLLSGVAVRDVILYLSLSALGSTGYRLLDV